MKDLQQSRWEGGQNLSTTEAILIVAVAAAAEKSSFRDAVALQEMYSIGLGGNSEMLHHNRVNDITNNDKSIGIDVRVKAYWKMVLRLVSFGKFALNESYEIMTRHHKINVLL